MIPFPEAGSVAPDFELADSVGVRRRLGSLVASDRLVLIFFRGHW